MAEVENNANIYDHIYAIVMEIPKGRVTSYGAIAAALGMKGGARLVGYAMNHSLKDEQGIPAHRVVNRNGLLTGRHHFSPSGKMQALLEEEGIEVKDHQILHFDRFFWDPLTELKIN